MWGWKIKIFKTQEAMASWLQRNGRRVQWQEIFVNNAYAVEYRKLVKI
jgi:hypothetical protein